MASLQQDSSPFYFSPKGLSDALDSTDGMPGAIAHLTDEPALFASSRKHARKVLEQLQRLGYFGGVPFAEAP